MVEQSAAVFLRDFDVRISAAREHILASKSAATVDGVCASLDKLHDDLAASAHILPAYDVRRAHETLSEVAAERQQKSETLSPRPPFRFRHRREKSPTEARYTAPMLGANARPSKAAPLKARIDSSSSVVFEGGTRAVEISNLTSDKRSVAFTATNSDGANSKARQPRDVSLIQLRDCTVDICDVSAAVRAINLVSCRIYVGPVAGSIHFTNCWGCTIHAAAQQVRLHKSQDCTFFLRTASPPIIEDCERVSFAPYGFRYALLDDHMRQAGLQDVSNEWSKVQDFSWLRNGPSPNWFIMDESLRPADVQIDSLRPAMLTS
jgi:tubulin-specific chaperone C